MSVHPREAAIHPHVLGRPCSVCGEPAVLELDCLGHTAAYLCRPCVVQCMDVAGAAGFWHRFVALWEAEPEGAVFADGISELVERWKAYVCPTCGRASWHPRNKFCGVCGFEADRGPR